MFKNALLLFITAIFLLAVYIPSFRLMDEKRRMNADYEAKIKELKETQARLAEEKKLLEEDPQYIERVGRERMGLIKEGEVVYKMEEK